jgi:tRNA 2-thiouridine synthesizing protein E
MGQSLQGKDRTYETDGDDFLENPYTWDENFAEQMADRVKISGALTASHWKVINFIRSTFLETGLCPPVYQTLRRLNLRIKDLKKLFPTGYLRGACKLAGLTYRAQHIHPLWLEKKGVEKIPEFLERRVYRVDAYGFLIDPSEWDEDFALHKSEELKMPEGLTHEHWKIIRFLRKRFQEKGSVPTVYETCEDTEIEIEDLERLFPDGYHRGAVKISGLCAI